MKILIVGSDLNTFLLAKYIKMQNSSHDIYITTNEQSDDDIYTAINIRENDIFSISDFVKYNQIEFTIALSQLAIINGIADIFKKEGFLIFSPLSEAARITFFNSIAKKIMYKLKINTPKFGIFDRENLALDYLRRSKFPVVIENDFTLLTRECSVYDTFSKAKLGLQKIFEDNNEKIVIESYIDVEPLYVYFITDGFNALPMIAIERNSGKNYSSTIAPSQKVSEELLVKILRTAIYPLLDDISKFAGCYAGIIGLKIKVINDNFCILEFYNGFQHYDFQAFLSLLSENVLDIFYSAAVGSLADMFNYIDLNDSFSYSIAIDKGSLIADYETDDYIQSEDEKKVIFTSVASTLNFAKENIFDFIQEMCDAELSQAVKKADKQREIRI